MTKILIIEDDSDISELIEYNFKQEKWECRLADNGSDGVALANSYHPDLIVLDLMLPDISGLDVCRKLKADVHTQKTPIIMLTAKSEEVDRIVGFEIGADDYVTKPFSPRELILRVKAIIKRVSTKVNEKPLPHVVQFGVLKFIPEKYEVYVHDELIQLTSLEFKILNYFLNNLGRVASRDILLDKVWGYDAELTTRTVDTHIKRLREKLGAAGEYIDTIRGVGYRFKEKP
jgi:two-component system, OmpR family, phosphate regulon response regulator PhoB